MWRLRTQYTGALKAAILDWSGTVTDRYVIAPAIVFQEVFKMKGVPITMEEARLPMGLRKDLHIQAITEIPEVQERWKDVFGKYPTSNDVNEMFSDFVPKQMECLSEYSQIIPGTNEAVAKLRNELQMKIGMTTGFTRPMADILLKEMKEQGFEPDVNVTGDEVEHGARPGPFMVYENLDRLGIFPISSVVKVDDTVGGVGEGLNAGCWTVGLSRYSNYMNINSYEEETKMTSYEIQLCNNESRKKLEEAGAHYVVDSIRELPEVCAEINEKLRMGIHP